MIGLNRTWGRARANLQAGRERGNSTVEFIGAAAGLLIPALLLIVAVVRVQSASFAAQSAAAEVARAYSLARTVNHAQSSATAIANLAFTDQGLSAPSVTAVCQNGDCQAAGTSIMIKVSASVPLVDFGNIRLGTYLVEATATSYVGEFVERSH